MKLKLGVHAMVVGVATVVLGWFMSSRAAESGALAMIVLYRSVESSDVGCHIQRVRWFRVRNGSARIVLRLWWLGRKRKSDE